MDSLAGLLDDLPTDPCSIAVEDTDGSLTWEQLRVRVDALVDALRDLGVRPGDRVGVMLESSVDAFVAVHGILRAGAVVVPLDPKAPATRVAALLRDCQVSVLVSAATARRHEQIAAECSLAAIVGPEHQPERLATRSWTDIGTGGSGIRETVEAGDPAYLIYTSGSTGRPKGIVHSHRSGLAYARLAASTYELGPDDVVATLSPLHFDQSTFSLYAAPFHDARVLMVPGTVLTFPADLTALMADRRVTVWYSVPTLLLQVLHRGVLDERDLTALRWVLFGGEVVRPADLAALMRRLPGARFSNVYGPAEVNQCTYHHLDGPPATDRAVPIGRAWDETEVCVVDDQGVPASEGELLVRSTTAMVGYWGDPDPSPAFRRGPDDPGDPSPGDPGNAGDPDDPDDDARWYATGDLARWDGDELVFIGRIDNQVKVRGHRIELEALDLALQDLEGVRAAATVVRSNDAGLDELVGLVEADVGFDPKSSRRLLARQLAPHALPAEVVVVHDLPRTSTGKVDRTAARRMLDEVDADAPRIVR